MRYILSILLLIALSSQTSGQPVKLERGDSLKFETFWRDFATAFCKKNVTVLRQYSLEMIDCTACEEWTPEHRKVTFKRLVAVVFDSAFHKRLSNAINLKSHFVHGYKQDKDKVQYYPPFMYEIMVTTYDPGELGKGHEGGQHVFQFISKNGKFYLWGFDTIP